MSLEVQFQIFFMSILFGMYLLSFYHFVNNFFCKNTITRFFFELPFFVGNFLLYYFLLFKLNDGIFNIYLILGILLGLYIHERYYATKFLSYYEFISNKFNVIIQSKKARRKKHGKNKKRKKFHENI